MDFFGRLCPPIHNVGVEHVAHKQQLPSFRHLLQLSEQPNIHIETRSRHDFLSAPVSIPTLNEHRSRSSIENKAIDHEHVRYLARNGQPLLSPSQNDTGFRSDYPANNGLRHVAKRKHSQIGSVSPAVKMGQACHSIKKMRRDCGESGLRFTSPPPTRLTSDLECSPPCISHDTNIRKQMDSVHDLRDTRVSKQWSQLQIGRSVDAQRDLQHSAIDR